MVRYLLRRLLQLAVVAFIISVLVFLLVHLLPGDPATIPLALVTSRRPNRPVDNVATTGTFGMLALPPFVIAPIMVAIFAVGLHWFPATGYAPISQELVTNLDDMI